MSLLLLFHPGVSGGPGPDPEPTEETVAQFEGPMGGALGRSRLERRRRIDQDDEDILTAVLAFLQVRR